MIKKTVKNKMIKKHILIIIEKGVLYQILKGYLEKEGYLVSNLEDGEQVIPFISQERPDLILMDILLSDMASLDLYLRIKKISNTPIFLITARDEEMDQIILLELGSRDNIYTHLTPQEVTAQVIAVLKRPKLSPSLNDQVKKTLELNEVTRQFFINGHELKLTPREFDLLKVMMIKPNQVFPRDQLMELFPRTGSKNERTLDTHIKNLRKKIALFLPNQKIICSMYGLGYRLNERNAGTIVLKGQKG